MATNSRTSGLMAVGNPTNIPGAYNWTAEYGGKPIVPDVNASAGEAISGNLSNLPSSLNLAGQVNTFNQGQLMNQLNTAIPNYSGLISDESSLIGNEMKGILPPDVLNLIAQQGAERGVAMGSPGSPNANAAWLRSLGLTSLDLQQTGLGNLSRMISQAPKAPLFNIESQFITPSDIQSAEWMRNEIAAAPDPKAAAELAIKLATESSAGGSRPPQQGTNWPTINPGPSAPRPAPGMPSSGASLNAPWAQDSSGNIIGQGISGYSQPYVDPNYYTNPAPFGSYTGYGTTKPTGSGNWYYDSTVGAYVNSLTGQISDDPTTGSTWDNFTWEGTNAPALEETVSDNFDY